MWRLLKVFLRLVAEEFAVTEHIEESTPLPTEEAPVVNCKGEFSSGTEDKNEKYRERN